MKIVEFHIRGIIKFFMMKIQVHVPLLFLLIFLFDNVNVKAGLAIDKQPDPPESHYGFPCNVDAYNAFRVPLLELQVNQSGDYEEQQVSLSKFKEFIYRDRTTNLSQEYSFIPTKYADKICYSKSTPLMCQLNNETTGDGTCICLKLDSVMTIPITYTFPFVHSNLEIKEFIPPTTTDSEMTTKSSRSHSASRLRERIRPGVQNVHLQVKYTRCLAKKGSFCETPFIACHQYPCMYKKCGGNTGTILSHPKWTFVLRAIIGYSLLVFCQIA